MTDPSLDREKLEAYITPLGYSLKSEETNTANDMHHSAKKEKAEELEALKDLLEQMGKTPWMKAGIQVEVVEEG